MILEPYWYEDEEDDEDEECEEGDGEDRGDAMGMKLLKTRTIVLSDAITKKLAQKITTQLLLLEQEDPEAPIKMFINSPGGDADAGFAIFDMMRFVRPEMITICAGITASAAVIILLAAKNEKRYTLPNARVLIHQPSTGVRGAASDIEIEASEILKCREKINSLIAAETGKDVKQVEEDTKRNFWMSADEAKEYGLVDKIIGSRSDLEGEA